MFIKDACKERIKSAGDSNLRQVIDSVTTLSRRGSQWVGKCPHCGTEGGLEFNQTKGIYKCFHCDEIKGNSSVAFVMQALKLTFPEALEYIAKTLGIVVEYEEPPKPRKKSKATAAAKDEDKGKNGSFLKEFLDGSGITLKDSQVTLKNSDGRTFVISSVFKAGTIDQSGKLTTEGNDVIIEYYDLDGAPVKYQRKDYKGRLTDEWCEYYRVRWQYPEEHKDKEGKAAKYHSPYGSGTYIYIPQYIRSIYKSGQTIDRLYVQEGEKKAEKACKHGIPSVAISGIMNIACQGKLSEDLIRIIQDLHVKEVCMIYDSDWNDLSKEIKIADRVEKRPLNFYYAANNFKDYMQSLINRNIYVECYIAHVIRNDAGDKGVDDLLVNTLKGKEDELKRDLDFLMNEKSLEGKYVKAYKITSWHEHKLKELWGLDNPHNFAKMHLDVLKDLPEFRIGRHTWRINDKDELETAQPFEEYERFWVDKVRTGRDGGERHDIEFDYKGCMYFLQNRGFGRLRRQDGSTFMFVRYEKPFLTQMEHYDIRDYVMEFADNFTSRQIQNMLLKGGTQYLGPNNLSNLAYVTPEFEKSRKDSQMFYFKNYCWEITANDIKQVEYANVSHCIWIDQKRDYEVHRTAPLMSVERIDDKNFRFIQKSKECQFLQFLINTSNFSWRKDAADLTDDDLQENTNHLIAKLCAIGFMCMSYKDMGVARAVVAMDGRQSEVGQSNGRSGKSLVGLLFEHILPYAYINGKGKDSSEDVFYFDGVDEKTKIVFIDDVRTNFSLEPLFAYITGDFSVNYKGGRRAVFPFSVSPKLYITTNHAINGTGSSFTDRQWKIAFSDYYNDNHKPSDDFGNLFFVDWDAHQWNLLWNLIAECIQLYLRFGVVQSPQERIEARQLRQQMGEMFLSWAEEYFSDPMHINHRLVRKDLYDNYLEYSNENRKYASPTAFKTRIKAYCQWRGLTLNPGRLDASTRKPLFYDKDGRADMDDKVGGVEYLTLGTEEYWNKNVQQNSPRQLSLAMEEFLNED